jgi:hypothetical protein
VNQPVTSSQLQEIPWSHFPHSLLEDGASRPRARAAGAPRASALQARGMGLLTPLLTLLLTPLLTLLLTPLLTLLLTPLALVAADSAPQKRQRGGGHNNAVVPRSVHLSEGGRRGARGGGGALRSSLCEIPFRAVAPTVG